MYVDLPNIGIQKKLIVVRIADNIVDGSCSFGEPS